MIYNQIGLYYKIQKKGQEIGTKALFVLYCRRRDLPESIRNQLLV